MYRLRRSAWHGFLIVGLAAMLIVPILFFYPLYWNFVTREPVWILFMQFHEPMEIVLLLEMALCVIAWFMAFALIVFYVKKLKTPPKL